MKQQLLIPGAIMLGGLLIAAVIVFDNVSSIHSNTVFAAERDENSYVFGNEDAGITIVEFSDFECPFCSRLHPTLERIVNESNGTIKWEYRHLPLPSHRNAESAAYAAECIGRLKGNDAFWQFAASAFSNQRSLSDSFYSAEASRLGIDAEAFASCMSSAETHEAVAADRDAAISFGGRGTPFSVIVFPDGTTKPVSGALPYEQWSILLTSQ